MKPDSAMLPPEETFCRLDFAISYFDFFVTFHRVLTLYHQDFTFSDRWIVDIMHGISRSTVAVAVTLATIIVCFFGIRAELNQASVGERECARNNAESNVNPHGQLKRLAIRSWTLRPIGVMAIRRIGAASADAPYPENMIRR
jgi:hypothetical protein